MSALAEFSIKQKDGTYKSYTISITDEPNQYGQNVSVYESQTKEQRESKAKKNYIGNGKVFWTDGNIKVAPRKQVPTQGKSESIAPIQDFNDDLPF